MDADNRMTIQQWLDVGDIFAELKRKKTSKRRASELNDALETWNKGAIEHGFSDAAEWRSHGYKASNGFADRHARFLANSGITAEEWKAKYAMPAL